jgi:hypothetical protein
MFWRRIVLLVPGTDEKLSVDMIGSEIMGAGFAVALYRSELRRGKRKAKSELGISLISPALVRFQWGRAHGRNDG